MNFFEHQDVARRNTRLLGILFTLAVVLLVSLVALLVAVFAGGLEQTQAQPAPGAPPPEWRIHWDIVIAAAGVALSMVGFAVLYKWVVLRPGGKVVAEHLGGRRLSPDSTDPLERKVLNVVEEMAIAANMPVPPVYLLDNEGAINAFAAGYSPRDAVIGITRGCAEKLTRAQLQGVVAHEIAHILNGDMRLNIRIIAILNGILFISHAGYLLLRVGALRGGRGDGKNAALPLLGLGLLVLGAIGVLFGNIIKAAVSRQREYLADASAAQFTREPEALSGALQQIGAAQHGSKVESPNADEAAHLFFSQAVGKLMSFMATHPPLKERIKRLTPQWNGEFKANPEAKPDLDESAQKQSQQQFVNRLSALVAALPIPDEMMEDARHPDRARALILALLLSEDADTREAQLKLLKERQSDELVRNVKNHIDSVKNLPTEDQLPLAELAMPALKMMDDRAASAFLATMQNVIEVDSKVTLYEWCLFEVVSRYLKGEHQRRDQVVGGVKKHRTGDAALSLSILARYGHASSEVSERAFKAARDIFSNQLNYRSDEQLNFSELSDALSRIEQWTALEKERLIKAWLKCVTFDSTITAVERKLLFTLCSCIGEPLPELPDQNEQTTA